MIAVLTVSTTAEATEIESHVVVSAPLILGVDASLEPTTTSTGAYLGVRPARFCVGLGRFAFGFGPYASFAASTGTSQVWLGGGGTIVGYFGSLGVALSGGGECDWLRPHRAPCRRSGPSWGGALWIEGQGRCRSIYRLAFASTSVLQSARFLGL